MGKQFWTVINSLEKNELMQVLPIKFSNIEGKIIFLQNCADTISFNKYFKSNINENNYKELEMTFPGTFYSLSDINENTITSHIYKGNIILYMDDENIYNIVLNNVPERGMEPSLVDPPNMYGSQKSLLENSEKNIAMIERVIKSKSLKTKKIKAGKRTNTDINLIYIGDIAYKRNVDLIYEKISNFNIDGLVSINDISNLFNEDYLFPLIGTTSSLDVVTSSLLEGRIIILIDGFPVCLILPINGAFFTTLKEEASSPFYYSIYIRILSIILLFLSVFFLGLYVAVINYHPESLSLIVLSEIKMTIRGTTIPLYAEIIYILLTFEFLRMASIRTPSNNIQNILVIVGGILIGQNSVNSGVIGAFNLVITSICFLSSFGITNDQHLVTSLSYLRFFIFFFSLILGFFGFIISSIISFVYLYNLKSLSTPYLTPILPPFANELKRIFIPKFLMKKPLRPESVHPNDNTL